MAKSKQAGSIASQRDLQLARERHLKNLLMTTETEYVASDKFTADTKGANWARQKAEQLGVSRRYDYGVNEDGTKMTLQDRIRFVEETGYGQYKDGENLTLQRLKAKLSAAPDEQPDQADIWADEQAA